MMLIFLREAALDIEFRRGTDHPLTHLAANPRLLERHHFRPVPAHPCADMRQRHAHADAKIGAATDDLLDSVVRLHIAERQTISVRMLLQRENFPDATMIEKPAENFDLIHFGHARGHALRDLLRIFDSESDEILQPIQRNLHDRSIRKEKPLWKLKNTVSRRDLRHRRLPWPHRL